MDENKESRYSETEKLVVDNQMKTQEYAYALFIMINSLRNSKFRVADRNDAEHGAYKGLMLAAKRFDMMKYKEEEFWKYAIKDVKKHALRELMFVECGKKGKSKKDNYIIVRDVFDEAEDEAYNKDLLAFQLAVVSEEELIREQKRMILKKMERLTKRQYEVVEMLFGFNTNQVTVRKAAELLGLTENHVSNILNQALRIMEE